MDEFDRSRKRKEQRDQTAIDIEIQLRKDLNELMPEINHLEKTFWQKKVPPRLVKLFEEVRENLEYKHNIKFSKQYALLFGKGFLEPYSTSRYENYDYTFSQGLAPRRTTTYLPGGDVILKLYPENSFSPLVEIWKRGKINSVHVQAVGVTYFTGEESKPEIIFGFTSPVINRQLINIDFLGNKISYEYSTVIKWFAGGGVHLRIEHLRDHVEYYYDQERSGYADISDEGLNKIADNLLIVLEREYYFWEDEATVFDRIFKKSMFYKLKIEPYQKKPLMSSQEVLRPEQDESTKILQEYNEQDKHRFKLKSIQQEQEDGWARDRVFSEIQNRAKEDPTFSWPNWIPTDYRYSSEEKLLYKRYDNDQEFVDDLKRYFPKPPDA